jgi:4-hydroxymandelate oxidase
MTEGQANKPSTISELFNRAVDNLKRKGTEVQLPVASNYSASSQAARELLDSIFIETRLFDPVDADSSLTLFGAKMKTPVFCSALSKPPYLSDEDMGELVRGVGKAGSIMMLGIGGSDLLQSAIDTRTPLIKMVKPYKDTELIYQKIRDAEARGCIGVGIDIDHFRGGFRDGRSRLTETFAPKGTPEVVQAISSTKLPFIFKGILSKSDALKAAELGASAIVVSNHGWGSFDFSVPSILALPGIAEAVGTRVTVLVDSGFRTGNDVFKAVALGAKGVGFASSILLASSAGGADGVEQFMGFVATEFKRTMAVTGCPDLSSVSRALLVASPKIRPWW